MPSLVTKDIIDKAIRAEWKRKSNSAPHTNHFFRLISIPVVTRFNCVPYLQIEAIKPSQDNWKIRHLFYFNTYQTIGNYVST